MHLADLEAFQLLYPVWLLSSSLFIWEVQGAIPRALDGVLLTHFSKQSECCLNMETLPSSRSRVKREGARAPLV